MSRPLLLAAFLLSTCSLMAQYPWPTQVPYMAPADNARVVLAKQGLTVRDGMMDWGAEQVLQATGYTWEGMKTDSVYVHYSNNAMSAITLYIPYEGAKTLDRVTDILTTKLGAPSRFGEDFAGWEGYDGDLVSIGVVTEDDLMTVRFAPDNFVFNDSTTVRRWPLALPLKTAREDVEDYAKDSGCVKKRIEESVLAFKNYSRNGFTADSLLIHIDAQNRAYKSELYYSFRDKTQREQAAKVFVDDLISHYGPHAVVESEYVYWNVGDKEAVTIGMYGSASTMLVSYDFVLMERLQHAKQKNEK